MIKIERVDVFGWEAAIRGLRNPMNSHDKSDSGLKIMNEDDAELGYAPIYEYVIGENDLTLMKKLCKAGTDHRKFLRMINVSMDITAPMFWWAEFDTYKVGTVRNSCSKMHRIHAHDIIPDNFTAEGLTELGGCYAEVFNDVVGACNALREMYNETHDRRYWRALIELLPESYNQRATVQLNYEVLHNMYHARKSHVLDEWVEFCGRIETLPYSELITG